MSLINKYTHYPIEAGCDEAGRGCLCGPVVAAAVILPEKFDAKEIDDSKKLNTKTRALLANYIMEHSTGYAIAEVSAKKIDEINILNASILAMHKAIEQLTLLPDIILVDGNRFHPYQNIPHECIVKGDQKILSIAAASILAKNHRDQLMLELHRIFPQYGWNENKGYATKTHREALLQFGPTKHHRKTFRLDYSNK